MDNAAFREAFPQFADTAAYPDARLTVVATFAEAMLNECRWGSAYSYGVMLYVAHLLVITGPSNATSGPGGGSSGGGITGPVTSKAVDKVSVSYDAGAVTYDGQAFWNLSRYGIELFQLIQMFGAGPVQVMGNTVILPFYGSGFSTLPGFLFP